MEAKKQGLRLSPDWKRVALGAGAGMLTLLTITGAAAGLMSREIIALESAGWCAAAALLASGVAAGRMGGKPLNAALAGLGVAVVLLGLNMAMFDGKMEGIGFSILALVGGCGAAILLPGGGGGHGKGHRRRGKIVKLPKTRRR